MSTAKYFRPLRKMSYAATCLVALISVSGLAREVLAAVPEICRVQGGNTKTIWGVGFMPDQTEVWDWKAPLDADAALAAWNATPDDAAGLLPAAPPEEKGPPGNIPGCSPRKHRSRNK